MQTCTTKSIRAALAFAMIMAAPGAHSAMYRWVDQNGATNYSDHLPQEPGKVRALTVLEAPAPASAYEKRSQQLIDAHNGRRGDAASSGVGPVAPETGELRGSARLSGLRAAQPEAPRDPCLRSSDPRCYEKNRDAYVPFLGYAPSMTRGTRSIDVPANTGASSGLSGTGAVSGGNPAARPVSSQRVQPWHVRNTLKDAKDLSR
jgi:Domain of unknown function (DUF4124)